MGISITRGLDGETGGQRRLSLGEQYSIVDDLPNHRDRPEPGSAKGADVCEERETSLLGVLRLPAPVLGETWSQRGNSGRLLPPSVPGVQSSLSPHFSAMHFADPFREADESGLLGSPRQAVTVQKYPRRPEQPSQVVVHLS